MDKEKAIIVDFFNELLDLYEFELLTDTNSDLENIFRLNDKQGANWSGIEQDEFSTLADVIERLSSPHEDYIYKSLEERKDANETIPKNDRDLTAKRYLESNTVANILSKINVEEYNRIMKQKEKFEIKDILKILDSEESFYKNICQKYVNTMSKEMLLEKDKLKKVGYGFMVKDQFPLIEKYAVSEEKIYEFFDYFSLEQLEDFEETLHLYFETEDIVYDKDTLELYSKSNKHFNPHIICLAEKAETLEDFLEDYKEKQSIKKDTILPKVIEYFEENQIKDLMNYGCDTDEGLSKLSSLYTEIMDKLNIKYSDIYTEDGASHGKYITTILFENNSKIDLDTKAWEGVEGVTSNIESIYEFYEKNKDNSKENEIDMEVEL